MLNKNIKKIRQSKSLSQEELAIKLNVVRQTVSKWERGLSVPDSEMLVSISDILDTPISTLLGETISENSQKDLKVISEKLEVITLELARQKAMRHKIGIFAVSTYNTDYILVKEENLERALSVLASEGYTVI